MKKTTKTKKIKIPIVVKKTVEKPKPKPEFILDKELDDVIAGVTRIMEALKSIPIFVVTCFSDNEYDITEVEYVPDDKKDALQMFNEVGQEIYNQFNIRGVKGIVLAANVSFIGPFPNDNLVTLKPEAETKALNPKTAVLFVAKDNQGIEKALLKTYEVVDEHGMEFIKFKSQEKIPDNPEMASQTNSFALMNELWIGYKFQSVVGGAQLTLLK